MWFSGLTLNHLTITFVFLGFRFNTESSYNHWCFSVGIHTKQCQKKKKFNSNLHTEQSHDQRNNAHRTRPQRRTALLSTDLRPHTIASFFSTMIISQQRNRLLQMQWNVGTDSVSLKQSQTSKRYRLDCDGLRSTSVSHGGALWTQNQGPATQNSTLSKVLFSKATSKQQQKLKWRLRYHSAKKDKKKKRASRYALLLFVVKCALTVFH